jgi:3-hydroxyisobutyrate dehydrogenase
MIGRRELSKVAFLGLGVMGFPMAGHLKVRGGHEVVVYNRTAATASKWVDAFAGMRPGAVFVDHTTASANVARELDREAKRRKFGFVDAPVSGGQAGAESGQLTVMCGGESEDYARVEPAISAYARFCCLMGPSGAGQLTKMVNQICIAGLVQALSEGLRFARAAGLDPQRVVDVISKGAAQSWQMDNRHKTMIAGEFKFGFAVDWMRKDLAICLDEARRNRASLPVTALVDQFYGEVQAKGGGRWDTSSLITRLQPDRRRTLSSSV